MTLHKLIFTIVFSAGFLFCSAQKLADTEKLRHDFLSDSLGCTGKRLSHIKVVNSLDSGTNQKVKKVLIAGIDLVHQKTDSLTKLIGVPNESSYRSETLSRIKWDSSIEIEHYWYYLTTCGKGKSGKILTITIFNGEIGDVEIRKQ